MIQKIAAEIKYLVLDVDGVLTDGRIFIDPRGEELKCFNVKDGLGLRLLMKAGIKVGIITGRNSTALEHRARDLGIEDLFQGHLDKGPLLKEIMTRHQLKKRHLCCMGDDITDLALFRESGLSIAVADAMVEVRQAAMVVTKNKGGHGAVREVCELLLKSQKKWVDFLGNYQIYEE